MTPDELARIRELPKLIATENDPAKKTKGTIIPRDGAPVSSVAKAELVPTGI